MGSMISQRVRRGHAGIVLAPLMLLALSGAATPARAQSAPPPPPAERLVLAEDEAYQKAIDSVVWITAFDRNWEKWFGTGVIVDAQRGYILTAYHVIGDHRIASVIFPERDAEGMVIGKADHYARTNLTVCTVVECDAGRDLALLRLKWGGTGLKALPLAPRSPTPGAALFTIGNDAGNGVLWRYSGGSVRQVYDDQYRFADGQQIAARVVQMTVPVNPGDSGGPILNRYGELVGINSAIVRDENQVQKGIDVSEIRAFLRKVEARDLAAKAETGK